MQAALDEQVTPKTSRSRDRQRLQSLETLAQRHSIRLRLYSVVILLFVLLVGLGAFGSAHLRDVNHASEVIRNHWLRDTAFSAIFRTTCPTTAPPRPIVCCPSTAAEAAASDKEIDALRETVAASQRAYEQIAQEPAEAGFTANSPENGRPTRESQTRSSVLRARAEPRATELYKRNRARRSMYRATP